MQLHLNKPIPKFSPMAIDIETSDLDPYQGRILSIAVSNGEDVWVLLDIHGFDQIIPILEDESIQKIAHNAKFEYVWFKHHLGVDTKNMYDTFLAEKIISEDDMLPMGLDELIARYIGKLVTKDTRRTFENHPGFKVRPITNSQIEYIANDVLSLPAIQVQQKSYIESKDLQRTVDLEFSIIPAIAELELSGVTLDIDLWYEQVAQFEELASAIDNKMRELIGKDYILHVPAKKKGEDIIKEIPCADINLNSPIQIKTLINDKFLTQIDSTAAAILVTVSESNSAASDFARLLLNHRGYRKRIGFDYVKFVHPVTGKVHPTYHQLGARTGRLSCSKPNLQQVPRPIKGEPNMRNLWKADNEDYVVIRADYSQQEPRVMAQLCGDPAMIEACNSDDVYIEFGKHIFGHEIQKGSDERFTAKTFVLAVGYGAGASTLSEESGKDEATCLAIKNKIRETFPIMAKYGNRMYRQLNQYGYVETSIGRRRYISNKLFTIAVNTPVQGTAADMFKLSLYKIHTALTELKSCGKLNANTRVWNLVHDEIEVHCHKDEVDSVIPLVKELMEEAGHEICPDVLHLAEVEYGYRWDK